MFLETSPLSVSPPISASALGALTRVSALVVGEPRPAALTAVARRGAATVAIVVLGASAAPDDLLDGVGAIAPAHGVVRLPVLVAGPAPPTIGAVGTARLVIELIAATTEGVLDFGRLAAAHGLS